MLGKKHYLAQKYLMRKMMKKIVSISLGLCLLMQAYPQASKADDIRKLIDMTGTASPANVVVNSMMTLFSFSYQGLGGSVMDSIQTYFANAMTELRDSVALIYDQTYTQAEIKEMIKFYNTPLGKKMIETMPQVSEKAMNALINWSMVNPPTFGQDMGYDTTANTERDYGEYYFPDEVYDADVPYEYNTPENATNLFESSDYYYKVGYSDDWEVIPNEDLNSDANVSFRLRNTDVYGMVIAEYDYLTLQELKAAAFQNINKVSESMSPTVTVLRKVNGEEVLYAEVKATINDSTYVYRSYYYTQDGQLLQFITFCLESELGTYGDKMEALLNGISIW